MVGVGRSPLFAQGSTPPEMFRGGPAHTAVYRGGGTALAGLAWRAATDGDVISSPTIAGNVVYVGSNDGYLYAFDLHTGTRRWRANLGSGVASSPAVGEGLVYAAARDGTVSAFDVATGQRRWRITTRALFPLPWGHESGDYYVSSPVYVDGTILFGAGDGGMYAADAKTGKIRWRAQTGGRIRSSPAVAGGRVYVGAFDGRVYALDLATGAERWRYETEGASLKSENFGYDRRSIQSSPTVANGVVYVGARDGYLYALDAAAGTLRWRFDHKVSWIITSPAVADDVVYAGSSDGHFLNAVDATGKELWRVTVEGIVWSSPAVAGSLVYFGENSGRLHAVDRSTGTERWAFRTGGRVYSSPAVSGEYVVVGSTDGSVYALRATDGPPVLRAVFFDSSYVRLGHIDRSAENAQYLISRGYGVIDSLALISFLSERVADRAPSVVVFPVDYVPAAALAAPVESSLLRRYLNAGGKVVWMGPPPRMLPPERQAGGTVSLGWARDGALLSVPHDSALFDTRGVRTTADGTRWGLPERWRDAWSVAPAGVTRVLGMDEWGLAAAWVKNYGGPEGTGFVRVPNSDPLAIYLAAEYRQRE